MTEKERDKLLHQTEVLFMRNKINCKTESRQKMYGCGITAIHRERTYHLQEVNLVCKRVYEALEHVADEKVDLLEESK